MSDQLKQIRPLDGIATREHKDWNLHRGNLIDELLALILAEFQRVAESTAQWLQTHPGAEIVSRDRASLYAEAATKAAPNAVQVADRWHRLHNMSQALQSVLVPHHHLLAEVPPVRRQRSASASLVCRATTNLYSASIS